MQLELLVGKLHAATVTECRLNYQGSVTIDRDLYEAVGLVANQRVDVYNINNGERFSTYILEGKRGSKTIGLNGAAARLVQLGDRVIIAGYGIFTQEEAKKHEPKIAVLDEKNKIVSMGH
jgi:aspartate 1-decarboxylase